MVKKVPFKRNITIIIFAVIAVAFVAITLMMQRDATHSSIDSYQKCADAGYPIQESFPTRCVTPDGKSFVGPTE